MPTWTTRIVCAQPDGNKFRPDLSGIGDVIQIQYGDGTNLPKCDILVMIEPPLDWLERVEIESKSVSISLLAMSEPTAQHIRVALNRLEVDAICDLDGVYEKVESLLKQIWAERAKQELFAMEPKG
jgi:hypothetical protein